MKRTIMSLCTAVAVAILAGCSTPTGPIVSRASLLFDPQPGVYQPRAFAARAPWPTARSYVEDGEALTYREYFYDRQGRGFLDHGYLIRRFTQVREGRGHR